MFRDRRALDPRLRPEAASVVTLSRRGALVLAFFLVALFAALSFWEMTGDSLTIDERVYLPTGYAYWTQRDFSLNREHPPFAKLWAALPLLAMDLKLPPVSPAENALPAAAARPRVDRKSTRLNSSHLVISYAVFCLKKK